MGADLYIMSITNKAKAENEGRFDAAVEARNAYRGDDTAKYEELQAEVDKWYEAMYPENGYFRDSYNATSVFNMMGLSWWRDVGALLDEVKCEYGDGDEYGDSTLSGAQLLKFRQMVADAELQKVTADDLRGRNAVVDDGENSVDVWNTYFTEKRERLLRFIDHAIELGEGIYCSI